MGRVQTLVARLARGVGAPRCALAGALLAVAAALGCAGDVVAVEGGYRNKRHDYRFEAPGGPGPAWERVRLKGADIAFRRPGPETLIVQSRCGRPVARPEIMARQLVIGIEPRRIEDGEAVQVDGLPAWRQTIESRGVRVKTVTAVAGDCTVDWMLTLSGPGPHDDAEAAFEAWVASFRLAGLLGRTALAEPANP
jgi:hypothetical protein